MTRRSFIGWIGAAAVALGLPRLSGANRKSSLPLPDGWMPLQIHGRLEGRGKYKAIIGRSQHNVKSIRGKVDANGEAYTELTYDLAGFASWNHRGTAYVINTRDVEIPAGTVVIGYRLPYTVGDDVPIYQTSWDGGGRTT